MITVRQTHHKARYGKVAGCLVHSMGEYILTATGPVYGPTFLEDSGLSAHAFIPPDGNVIRGVDTERVAYHAGKSRWKGIEGLNGTFLGVELLVQGEHTFSTFVKRIQEPDCYTEDQYKGLGQLLAAWGRRYGFDKPMILGHSMVSGPDVRDDPKPDPGDGFDWDRLWPHYTPWRHPVAT